METITVLKKPEFTGVFSKEYLQNTFMNNEETVKSLLALFLERTNQQLIDMSALIENQNWEEMNRIAHIIRGSATTLSGMELGQAAGRIEKAYKQNDTAEMAVAFPFVVKAFQHFKVAAEEYIHK